MSLGVRPPRRNPLRVYAHGRRLRQTAVFAAFDREGNDRHGASCGLLQGRFHVLQKRRHVAALQTAEHDLGLRLGRLGGLLDLDVVDGNGIRANHVGIRVRVLDQQGLRLTTLPDKPRRDRGEHALRNGYRQVCVLIHEGETHLVNVQCIQVLSRHTLH